MKWEWSAPQEDSFVQGLFQLLGLLRGDWIIRGINFINGFNLWWIHNWMWVRGWAWLEEAGCYSYGFLKGCILLLFPSSPTQPPPHTCSLSIMMRVVLLQPILTIITYCITPHNKPRNNGPDGMEVYQQIKVKENNRIKHNSLIFLSLKKLDYK